MAISDECMLDFECGCRGTRSPARANFELIPRAVPGSIDRLVIMKRFNFAILAIAIALAPAAALAGSNSYGTPSPQMRAAFQSMDQAHARVEQLHSQARLAVLNVLTTGQRNLLAQVVGQLAISASPNIAAAARTVDNSLSQAQGRTILSISSSLETQSRQIMDAAHHQMMAARPQSATTTQGLPGTGGPGMGGPWMHMHHGDMSGSQAQSTDPGMLLLLMSMHAIHPDVMFMER